MGGLSYTHQQKVKTTVLNHHQTFLNYIEHKDKPERTLADWIKFDQQAMSRAEYWAGAKR